MTIEWKEAEATQRKRTWDNYQGFTTRHCSAVVGDWHVMVANTFSGRVDAWWISVFADGKLQTRLMAEGMSMEEAQKKAHSVLFECVNGQTRLLQETLEAIGEP